MEKGTGLQIPWRLLKDKLVSVDPETKNIKYETTFEIKNDEHSVSMSICIIA